LKVKRATKLKNQHKFDAMFKTTEATIAGDFCIVGYTHSRPLCYYFTAQHVTACVHRVISSATNCRGRHRRRQLEVSRLNHVYGWRIARTRFAEVRQVMRDVQACRHVL